MMSAKDRRDRAYELSRLTSSGVLPNWSTAERVEEATRWVRATSATEAERDQCLAWLVSLGFTVDAVARRVGLDVDDVQAALSRVAGMVSDGDS